MPHPFDVTRNLFESAKAEKGVIRGVKIIGKESRNGRRYTDKALAEAVTKYEGAKVYLDHDRSGEERGIRDYFGHFESVSNRPDGIYGDLHYLETHSYAPTLAEASTRASFAKDIGMSHNAKGTTKRDGGKVVVESIDEVYSVDLVTNPATTSGLFESIQRESVIAHVRELLETHPEGVALLEQYAPDAEMGTNAALADAIVAAVTAIIRDESLDSGAKKSKCGKLIDMLAGIDVEADSDEEMPPGDEPEEEEETQESIEMKPAELKSAITEAVAEATKPLREQLESIKAANEKSTREASTRRLLEDASVDLAQCDAAILESLSKVDEAAQKAIVSSLPKKTESRARRERPLMESAASAGSQSYSDLTKGGFAAAVS